MSKTTFSGPVRTGKDTGAPATTTIGTLIAEQHVTVLSSTSGGQSMVIPANSKLVDFVFQNRVAVAGSGAIAAEIHVGTTGDATRFANLTVSAVGSYRMGVAPNVATVSAAACESVGTSPQRIFVEVSADTSSTDLTGFSGVLSIFYVQR